MNKNKHGVDLSAIKPGDTVTITAVVGKSTATGRALVASGLNIILTEGWWGEHSGKTQTPVSVDLITAHTPKPREIQVGDVYEHATNPTAEYTVRAIHGQQVWVTWPDDRNGEMGVIRHVSIIREHWKFLRCS